MLSADSLAFPVIYGEVAKAEGREEPEDDLGTRRDRGNRPNEPSGSGDSSTLSADSLAFATYGTNASASNAEADPKLDICVTDACSTSSKGVRIKYVIQALIANWKGGPRYLKIPNSTDIRPQMS